MMRIVLFALIGTGFLNSCGRNARSPKPPRLVVLICVDQLPYEYLSRFQPFFGKGGFNRLLSEGASFSSCQYDHGYTQTSPGHASIATGAYPSVHGIIANEWYDRKKAREQYSVADDAFQTVGGSSTEGRSPRNLLMSTLGDEMKLATYGKAKVLAVSNKDRSSILLAGHRADAAYWIDDKAGHFVTSSYYREKLPPWVQSYNNTKPLDKWVGQKWTRALDSSDYPWEDPDMRAHYNPHGTDSVFPYRLGDGKTNGGTYYRDLRRSPFGSVPVLEFAMEAVRREGLGSDEIPDLLCISLSSTDYVGHDFGPHSQEIMDAMVRTDGYLGNFFQELDRFVGLRNVLVILTSDHGTGPIPEAVNPHPEAFRVRERVARQLVDSAMNARYGTVPAGTSYLSWFKEGRLYFNYGVLEQKRIDKQEASEYITAVFENRVPGVFRTYTERQLNGGGSGADFIDGRIRRSYVKGVSGDVYVVLKPFYLWDEDDRSADHFHPWTYDSHVPLLLSGPLWIKQGQYAQRCSPIDIVPTVVDLVQCALPTGSEGRVLTEAILH